jgi:hypothetical protein
MAILIEQQKKSTNWSVIIGVLVFVFILFIGSYYLFFKQPQVIEELITSSGQKEIESLSQVKPEYVAIVEQLNKFYKKAEVTQIIQPQLGRQNPFQQF